MVAAYNPRIQKAAGNTFTGWWKSFVAAFFVSIAAAFVTQLDAATIFIDDFDGGQAFGSGVSGGFSGISTTTGVQGYAGLGTGANIFDGDFLINDSGGTPGSPGTVAPEATVLTLSGLPSHTHIDIDFLLAIIDTWDGEGPVSQAPDFLNVRVDGNVIFTESFLNSLIAGLTQSYVPPAGGQLANNQPLGFRNANQHDSDDAYDMGLDSTFSAIPHTSSTLLIEWFASGDGWQGEEAVDESWAIENVEVNTLLIPEPSAFTLAVVALVGLLAHRRRRA